MYIILSLLHSANCVKITIFQFHQQPILPTIKILDIHVRMAPYEIYK